MPRNKISANKDDLIDISAGEEMTQNTSNNITNINIPIKNFHKINKSTMLTAK